METSLTRLVENYFNAYETQDREVLEQLMSGDFTYNSPKDNKIDKAEYFSKCWLENESKPVYTIEKILESNHEVMVIYSCKTADGNAFRNVEFFTFEEGQVKSIDVFYGQRS